MQTTFFMDDKLERLQKAVDALKYLGVFKTHQDAANQMLMSRPNFSAALNGSEKYFTENFLDRFLSVFGNTISSAWLLAGEGEMLVKDSSCDSISSLPHQKVKITDKHGSTSQVEAVRVDEMEDYTRAKEIGVSLIPQYEEGFRGGYEGEKDEIKSISTYWGLPNVAGQSMYPVRGDSMAPKYPADCKVVIKDFTFNPAEPFTIPFGETFAIAVNINGTINYYVKRLFKHPDRDKQKTTYIARSYNPDFEDFEIPIQNIAYLGIVVARVSVDITCNY